MKLLDKFIRSIRVDKAIKNIPKNSKVLDIGCHDGYLLNKIKDSISFGYGIDLNLPDKILPSENIKLTEGDFTKLDEKFDIITLLAIIEHFYEAFLGELPKILSNLLNENGKVIITVPHPFVDKILDVLVFMRLVNHDEMDIDAHHGLKVKDMEDVFLNGNFCIEKKQTFEFGLNYLYIFRKIH